MRYRPLNEEAKVLAKKLMSLEGPQTVVLKTLTDATQLLVQAKAYLREGGSSDDEQFKEYMKKLDAIKQNAKKEMLKVIQEHDDIIAAMRRAQPELDDFEFQVGEDLASYKITDERQTDEEIEETKEINERGAEQLAVEIIKKLQQRK